MKLYSRVQIHGLVQAECEGLIRDNANVEQVEGGILDEHIWDADKNIINRFIERIKYGDRQIEVVYSCGGGGTVKYKPTGHNSADSKRKAQSLKGWKGFKK